MARNLLSKTKHKFRFQKLGHRLSFYFISICVVFAMATIASLLYKQYLDGKASVYKEGLETIQAVEQQLSRSLWNVDHESTQLILEGMNRMPSIQGLRVVESLGHVHEQGKLEGVPSLSHELIFNKQNLGRLEVEINEDFITDDLLKNTKIIIISTLVAIGLIGFSFSIVVKRLVTTHLVNISEATSDPERLTSKTPVPIKLDRSEFNDELTELVETLNKGQKQIAEFALARESYENQLEYHANFDVLTSLPNRRHIDHHMKEEMAHHQPGDTNGKLAMFFIDLDGFKEVNDSLGHSVGDRILQDSATRLKNLIDKYDGYVARFGGDEFIASFKCRVRADAAMIAEETIHAFKENFDTDDAHLQLGCSIGVVLYPEDGETTEELIQKADTAMYKAKENGRNTYAFFDQSMMQDIVLNNSIKSKLQTVIANNKLRLHFQPLINLKTMSITGFEALLRWEDEDLGNVRPDVFIPIAEKAGLIFDIDTWVFEQSIQQVKEWRNTFDQKFIISVNFSPTNFHHRQLSSWVKEHDVFLQELDWVELEVTERMMLDDDPVVLKGIKQLISAGLKFSIDDFGTGYSSLGYIKKFSHILSKIKIDRLFVNEIISSNSDRALVKSIVTLADSLNIEVLAEGIESKKQEEVLASLGCDYAQGYHYARPLPADDIPAFISRWSKTPHIVQSV